MERRINYEPNLNDNIWGRVAVYALLAFPILDYTLRTFIYPIGVAWDKIALAVLVVIAFRRWRAGRRPARFSWHRYALVFILYGFLLLLAGLFTHPLQAAEGYQFDVYYLLFSFFIPFLVGPDDVRPLLHFAAVLAIAIAVHAVYQYITKVPIPKDWVDAHEHVRTRVFSVIKSPNELGSFMALNTPVLTGLALSERIRRRQVFYSVGVVLCFSALLFTFTRGAWLALVLAVLISAVLFERRLLVIVVIFAVLAFFVPVIHHRILDVFSPVYWHKMEKYGRFARWMVGIQKLRADPLFGAGLGQYGGAVAAHYGHSVYSDNFYMKTLGETGIVGLLLFLTMHLTLVRNLYVRVKATLRQKERLLLVGGLTGIMAVLFHNLTENVFEYAPMVLAYFMYAMLFLILGTKTSSRDS